MSDTRVNDDSVFTSEWTFKFDCRLLYSHSYFHSSSSWLPAPSDPCSYDPDLSTEPFSALSVSQHLLNILPPVTVHRLSCHAVTPVWQVFIPRRRRRAAVPLRVRRRKVPCGFFASLTIYMMPLHVIYTGLMVMLFRAAQESTKPCARLFNAVQKRHLQMQTHRSRSACPHLHLLLKFIKCIFLIKKKYFLNITLYMQRQFLVTTPVKLQK